MLLILKIYKYKIARIKMTTTNNKTRTKKKTQNTTQQQITVLSISKLSEKDNDWLEWVFKLIAK